MKRIAVRPAATADLDEQVDYYTLNEGSELAERFVAATRDSLRRLLEMPEIGRRCEHVPIEGVCRWPVKGFEKHLIFYRPTDSGIEVVRVLHGARDIDTVFLDDS